MPRLLMLFALLVCASAHAAIVGQDPYDQEVDHVYLQQGDQQFYMDIFTPNGKFRHDFYKPNDNGHGYAVIDIISGGWNTSRARLEEHKAFQTFGIFCARGYTVFAVRPGNKVEYTLDEMVTHIKHAIRYVKANAEKYSINPDKIGLMGASAGGHLALMTILNPEPGTPDADDPLLRFDTTVAAAGIFFPPTDFGNWEDEKPGALRERIGEILVPKGLENTSDEELRAIAAKVSPINHVKKVETPFLFFHGDLDPVVPLSQSELMVKALREAGNEADLIVKKGGAHPWLTMPEEIITLADFYDRKLAGR
jgi:acetyl esterase/lipase